MEDNVGTIVIGTKVDTKGLEKGIKKVKENVDNYEKENSINTELNIDTKKAEKTLGKISSYVEELDDKEVKIDFDYEPDTAPSHISKVLKNTYYNVGDQVKVEDAAIDNLKEEQRQEEIRQGIIEKVNERLKEQKKIQEENLILEQARNHYMSKREDYSLEFDVGVDESQYDERLLELKDKADLLARNIGQKEIEYSKTVDIIAQKEKELYLYEQQNAEYITQANELERLNQLKLNGVELTEQETQEWLKLGNSGELLEGIRNKHIELKSSVEETSDKLWEQQSNIEMLVAKYERLKNKAQEYADTTKGSGVNLGGLQKGFSKLVAKAGKLALALVGVRTIINLITRSFNTLTEYNEELGTKMEQMRLVLAVALEPIINFIVQLLSVVLNLIDKIYSALFGISLYGRASELWSKKMAKNMESGAGSAKEMRKQLAGFDEMNVLNDNVAGSGGGGFDPQDFLLPDTPIPKGLQWIMDNAEPLGAIMGGVAGGALLLADGLINLNIALQEYDKNPTLENFGEVAHRGGEALAGFGMLVMDFPTVIGGALMAIAGLLTKYKDEVYKWVDGIVKKIYGQAEWLTNNISATLGALWKNVGDGIKFVVDAFYKLMEEVKLDFDKIRQIIKLFISGDLKGAFNEVINWLKEKWQMEKQRFLDIIEFLKTQIKTLLKGVIEDFNRIINTIIGIINGTIKTIQNLVGLAINWVNNKINLLLNAFGLMGTKIGDTISGAVRGAVNGALTFAENRINDFIRMINNVISIINKIPGVSIGRIGYISLPRMAVGGIINQPGRGVPVGGAIAGESGREGILPLTDKQAMAELGREIGKWISIQATVPVNIGNRQVARVIQELNTDREFATNS